MYIDFWICKNAVKAPRELNSLSSYICIMYVFQKRSVTVTKWIYSVHIWLEEKSECMEFKLVQIQFLLEKNYTHSGCWLSLDLKIVTFSISLWQLCVAKKGSCVRVRNLGSGIISVMNWLFNLDNSVTLQYQLIFWGIKSIIKIC